MVGASRVTAYQNVAIGVDPQGHQHATVLPCPGDHSPGSPVPRADRRNPDTPRPTASSHNALPGEDSSGDPRRPTATGREPTSPPRRHAHRRRGTDHRSGRTAIRTVPRDAFVPDDTAYANSIVITNAIRRHGPQLDLGTLATDRMFEMHPQRGKPA